MAWITTIDETQADGDLKQMYDGQRDAAGAVANVLKIRSLAPEVLRAHLSIYHAAMHASGELSRAQREMIAVTVSAVNRCHY